MKYTSHFLLILGLLLFSGCERNQGQAWGHLQVAYSSGDDAKSAMDYGPFSILDGKTEFRFSPKKGSREHTVSYNLEVAGWTRMKIRSEKELIDLVLPEMKFDPGEIYDITVPGLIHSEQPHPEASDLKAFWEYLFETRPHCGYSLAEVRSVLPESYREELDRQVSGRTFQIVFNWEHDERDLILSFQYEPDQKAILLRGIALNYLEENQ